MHAQSKEGITAKLNSSKFAHIDEHFLLVMLISCQCLALARTKSQKHAVEMELEQVKSEIQASENALTQARLAQKSTESELKTVRREQKKVEAELTATILDKQTAEATIFDMVFSLER